jgi:hypothetical protein
VDLFWLGVSGDRLPLESAELARKLRKEILDSFAVAAKGLSSVATHRRR